ncbi:hypothetical protein LTR17_004971 [Elasticomyces elasticus]|nr:hypothetical protein LTR17_004971 [Elasticomyces elasticus]
MSSPLCGKIPSPKTGPAVADDPVCFVPQASVELLYWPVSTISGDLCGRNASTMTMGPTISGRPNTYVTFNTTLTSPTVYIMLNGRWGYTSAGTTYANQTRVMLPHSSTAVSSYCANNNQTYDTPLSVNYADFNYPVPASAYRCQPKCFQPSSSSYETVSTFTLGDVSGTKTSNLYTTAQTLYAYSTYPLENLCSTIWDDYAPALMVPQELLSMHPVTELGGGGFCSFSVNEANVFFDPPKALTQVTSAAGPSVPPSPTTTQAPSISAEPAGSISAPTAISTIIPPSVATTTTPSQHVAHSTALASSSYALETEVGVSATDPTAVLSVSYSADDNVPTAISSTSLGSPVSSILTEDPAGRPASTSDPVTYLTPGNVPVPSITVDGVASISDVIQSSLPSTTAYMPTTFLYNSAEAGPDSAESVQPTAVASSSAQSGDPASSIDVGPDGIASAIAGVLGMSTLRISSGLDGSTTLHTIQQTEPQTAESAFTSSNEGSSLTAVGTSLPTLVDPATDERTTTDISQPSEPLTGLVWTGYDNSKFTFPAAVPSSATSLMPPSAIGAVLTGNGGVEITISEDHAGALRVGSLTLTQGQTTSLVGVGNVGIDSTGLSLADTTLAYSLLENTATFTESIASAQGIILTDSSGLEHTVSTDSQGALIFPTTTLLQGQIVSVSGIGNVMAEPSGLVVSGSLVTPSILQTWPQEHSALTASGTASGATTTQVASALSTGPSGGESIALYGSAAMASGPSPQSGEGSTTSLLQPVGQVMTFKGATYTADAAGVFTLAPGAELSPGGVATISGQTISLASSKPFIAVDGTTRSLLLPSLATGTITSKIPNPSSSTLGGAESGNEPQGAEGPISAAPTCDEWDKEAEDYAEYARSQA